MPESAIAIQPPRVAGIQCTSVPSYWTGSASASPSSQARPVGIAQPARAIPAHRKRVYAVLEHVDARLQAIGIVVGLDVDAALDDGRTAVELLGDEMHGGAVLRFARLEDAAMGVEARIFRQQ